ncbi:MAG: DUF4392 domain-containing protein [Peptococcaceae bacterium]|jgi:hypothetical protein|nr:DUF4392 domain-containing protein [Peptococcaceae bacterium]MDH7526182.1 DUF4392 domain-containing protein [Peptococcaceae bacterium]
MYLDDSVMLKIAESLDRLVSVDIPARGNIGVLYEAARKKQGAPLTLLAAELLMKSVKPGDYVMIATGWADQPWSLPNDSETDGPPGAVALARAVRIALKAIPIIVTDAQLIEGIKKVAIGAGMQVIDPELGKIALERNSTPTVSIIPFPLDHENGKIEAERLVEKWKPAACVAIERGGMNSAGRIHTMMGIDYSDSVAKIDHLFIKAREKGCVTIGIGDGGNELGMGKIVETVRAEVPRGAKCNCPCGEGIAAATDVDVLIASTMSNWGAYAICALIAAKTGIMAAMNDEVKEERVLREAADAGLHDAVGGLVEPGVDGAGLKVQLAIVTLIKATVLMAYKRYSNLPIIL